MRSKTKIIVLHMKEVVYTGIFILLGILFLILLFIMFSEKHTPADGTQEGTATACYQPGVYTQTLTLGESTLEMEITLDENNINSIRLLNVSEAVTTMYPLIQPVFDDLISQIYEKQSLEGLSIRDEERYTGSVLIQAIENTLQKARREVQ